MISAARFRFGLRLKLTAALISVVAVTILSAGYFTIRYSYEALKHQKQQDELVMARNIVAQVDEVLNKAKQTVEALARHPAIVSMDRSQQREALTLVTKVTELIDGILILDMNGRVRVTDRAEPNTGDLLPVEPHKHFVQPVERRRVAQFSDIFTSRSGELVVAINAPILHEGALAGVLSGVILLKNHSMGGIEGIRIGKSGYAYLVDSLGNVIIHPQRTKLLENFSANPAVQQLLKKREGVIEFVNQEDVPIVAAFAPIEQTGWGVVVRQPTAETYAYANQILFFLSLVFFISLVAAASIGIYLAHKIAKPVTTLVQGVKKVTAGDMETQIPITGQDEIGQLASAFNEMTQKLKHHLDEIQKSHERVLETQKQLAQSEKLAAIGQLAAGLAHEINNPLNIISGFNELLREQTPENDPRRANLEEIYRETGRCQKQVAELLHFAKPKDPERAPTDIGKLVEGTLNLMQSQAKALGIEIENRADSELPLLQVDADQIKQALLNLLINACQAMPEGGRLSVRSGRINRHVAIRIEDTGKGISKSDMDNIFNPFFTTKEEGTGLGLPLSYALVERHGGKIQVHSEEGHGSVFTVLLPIAEGDDEKST